MDGFDCLPDSLILLVFNSVSDIKTLIRCRAVSKRFNSLVPQTESLLLRVDCVISSESDADFFLLTFLKIILRSFHDLISLKSNPIHSRTQTQNSPAQILAQFDRIRDLAIELPAGDLRLEKGAVVKWRAEFGKTLKRCVIVGFRGMRKSSPEMEYAGNDGGDGADFAGGLKTRVVWTISALIAASARHFLLKEVVKEHREMERLVLMDREGEGTMVMDKEGLRECREEEAQVSDGWDRSRTVVPGVRMRMRNEARLQLQNGVWLEGATLVVVRPTEKDEAQESDGDVGESTDDGDLALGAFDGVYGEAVQALLKSKSYLLEMNSF